MGRAFEFRKGAKLKRWGKMSRVFPKLGKAITIAAKEGGGDPSMNSHLRTAIQNAKAENMPKDNIERAIKKAEGKDASNYEETTFEGKGPHGVLVFVETATDNNTRTVANVKSYFNKCKPDGGQLLTNGSLEFMFDHKTVIEFVKPADLDLEELELELIDAGLDEIEEYEDEDGVKMAVVYGEFKDFGSLVAGMEEQKIEVKSANAKRFANDPKEFTDEQIDDIHVFMDKLDEDDDVQAVYNNLA